MYFITRCKKFNIPSNDFLIDWKNAKKKEILFALEKKTKYHRALIKEEEKKPVLPAQLERILKIFQVDK